MDQIWLWVGFHIFIFAMLALDLGVFHKDSHEVSIKESLLWSLAWMALALLFNVGVWHFGGKEKGLQFLTGYVLERTLSIDNIFVFILIFSCFKVAPKYQYKILFWGILGALVMRALFIAVGVALIERFHWVIYVFGAFLVFTGVKLLFEKEGDEHELDPDKSRVIRIFKRFMPVTRENEDGKFFVKKEGKTFATPLFIVLLIVETTDVIFAVDSIPAVLAITHDPFIVYTSNVFAILGLRALYFAMAGIMKLFHYLNYGLSVILMFVGVKMLLVDIWHVPIGLALGVIGGVLALSVVASLIWPKKDGIRCKV